MYSIITWQINTTLECGSADGAISTKSVYAKVKLKYDLQFVTEWTAGIVHFVFSKTFLKIIEQLVKFVQSDFTNVSCFIKTRW